MRNPATILIALLTLAGGTAARAGTPLPSIKQPERLRLSRQAFSFGPNFIGSPRTAMVTRVHNPGQAAVAIQTGIKGDPGFSVDPNGEGSCSGSLEPGASCNLWVKFLPADIPATQRTAILYVGRDLLHGDVEPVLLSGRARKLTEGTVIASTNAQVAAYTVDLPFPGTVTVNFGQDTSYGYTTSTRTLDSPGPVTILVAGMLDSTTYHMQATVQLKNGVTATDADHTFTAHAPSSLPSFHVDTPSGLSPQAGVEQLSMISGSALGIVATDLQGREIWSYLVPNDFGGFTVEGAKLMANGDFVMNIGQGSSHPLDGGPVFPNVIVAIREVDLAGNIVRQVAADQLTQRLQAAGYNLKLEQFHHEVTPLPNGHTLILSNTLKNFTDLPGYPGMTAVLGDVVIDLDENFNPVWVWNTFDHLDVNRHPMSFPDWTHSNAIVYSPDDGAILLSLRHQNWVIKIDYRNGAGQGDILWRLGNGGDFALINGTESTDWQYAQHFPSLFSTNSSGNFSLGLMDNGNDRMFPAGVTCDTKGAPPCHYSTIPVFAIDEGARTARLTFHQILPTSLYNFFGGNTDLLANGNIEYDLAGINGGSDIFEVTPTDTPQTVWHMRVDGGYAYRGFRLPSLYPGVQWK